MNKRVYVPIEALPEAEAVNNFCVLRNNTLPELKFTVKLAGSLELKAKLTEPEAQYVGTKFNINNLLV